MTKIIGIIFLGCFNLFAVTLEENYLQKTTYRGEVTKDGIFTFTVKFPNVKATTPLSVIQFMTENQAALKASDPFVSALTVATENKNKIITANIKILHVFPDKVQISCSVNTVNNETINTCEMTDADYMLKKFISLEEKLTCNFNQCVFTSTAAVAKSMFGFSKTDLALTLADVAIARTTTLGYLVNAKIDANNTYDALAKKFKSLPLFQNEVDHLDKSHEDLLESMEDGRCEKITFDFNGVKRSGSCL